VPPLIARTYDGMGRGALSRGPDNGSSDKRRAYAVIVIGFCGGLDRVPRFPGMVSAESRAAGRPNEAAPAEGRISL